MSDEIGRERWARHEAVSDFPPTRAFARPLGVHVAQRVCRKARWRLHGLRFFGLPIVLVMWVEDWFLSDKIGLGMKVATSACVLEVDPAFTTISAWIAWGGQSKSKC
jgi:hypothetical protein